MNVCRGTMHVVCKIRLIIRSYLSGKRGRMGRIIAITNQKGGVGKTTTTVNLSAAIGECGHKVLLVDMDPQGNATSGVGVDRRECENTVYEMLLGEVPFSDCVIKTDFKKLRVLPANIDLSGFEIDIIDKEGREFLLKNILDQIKNRFEYIIIDCPPSLNMLTVNALTAADTVIVPIQCEYYALEGLSQLLHTVNLVQDRLNPILEVEGVVFTMFDARTNLSSQVIESVRQNLNENIYKTVIPRNIKLAEAPSFGMPITAYAPSSTGAESYRQLAKEVIKYKKKRGRK